MHYKSIRYIRHNRAFLVLAMARCDDMRHVEQRNSTTMCVVGVNYLRRYREWWPFETMQTAKTKIIHTHTHTGAHTE